MARLSIQCTISGGQVELQLTPSNVPWYRGGLRGEGSRGSRPPSFRTTLKIFYKKISSENDLLEHRSLFPPTPRGSTWGNLGFMEGSPLGPYLRIGMTEGSPQRPYLRISMMEGSKGLFWVWKCWLEGIFWICELHLDFFGVAKIQTF